MPTLQAQDAVDQGSWYMYKHATSFAQRHHQAKVDKYAKNGQRLHLLAQRSSSGLPAKIFEVVSPLNQPSPDLDKLVYLLAKTPRLNSHSGSARGAALAHSHSMPASMFDSLPSTFTATGTRSSVTRQASSNPQYMGEISELLPEVCKLMALNNKQAHSTVSTAISSHVVSDGQVGEMVSHGCSSSQDAHVALSSGRQCGTGVVAGMLNKGSAVSSDIHRSTSLQLPTDTFVQSLASPAKPPVTPGPLKPSRAQHFTPAKVPHFDTSIPTQAVTAAGAADEAANAAVGVLKPRPSYNNQDTATLASTLSNVSTPLSDITLDGKSSGMFPDHSAPAERGMLLVDNLLFDDASVRSTKTASEIRSSSDDSPMAAPKQGVALAPGLRLDVMDIFNIQSAGPDCDDERVKPSVEEADVLLTSPTGWPKKRLSGSTGGFQPQLEALIEQPCDSTGTCTPHDSQITSVQDIIFATSRMQSSTSLGGLGPVGAAGMHRVTGVSMRSDVGSVASSDSQVTIMLPMPEMSALQSRPATDKISVAEKVSGQPPIASNDDTLLRNSITKESRAVVSSVKNTERLSTVSADVKTLKAVNLKGQPVGAAPAAMSRVQGLISSSCMGPISNSSSVAGPCTPGKPLHESVCGDRQGSGRSSDCSDGTVGNVQIHEMYGSRGQASNIGSREPGSESGVETPSASLTSPTMHTYLAADQVGNRQSFAWNPLYTTSTPGQSNADIAAQHAQHDRNVRESVGIDSQILSLHNEVNDSSQLVNTTNSRHRLAIAHAAAENDYISPQGETEKHESAHSTQRIDTPRIATISQASCRSVASTIPGVTATLHVPYADDLQTTSIQKALLGGDLETVSLPTEMTKSVPHIVDQGLCEEIEDDGDEFLSACDSWSVASMHSLVSSRNLSWDLDLETVKAMRARSRPNWAFTADHDSEAKLRSGTGVFMSRGASHRKAKGKKSFMSRVKKVFCMSGSKVKKGTD